MHSCVYIHQIWNTNLVQSESLDGFVFQIPIYHPLRPLYINMSGNMIYWRQIFQSFETIKTLGRAAIEKDSHLDKGTTYHRAKKSFDW